MVDFRRLSSRAKDLVEKRGGSESLKQDAAQLREIAKGKGTMSEKAKAAAAAIKDPGARPAGGGEATKPAPTADPAAKARADEKVAGEGRGKHAHAEKQGRETG